MKTKVFQDFSIEDFRKVMLMAEYDFFDGDDFITLNIVDINFDSSKITIAISNRGKISVDTFDLKQTCGKKLYFFEYGSPLPEVIYLNDFREVV